MQTRNPRPATQSPSTLDEAIEMNTNQASERMPAHTVATPGTRLRSWIRANALGIAPRRAIDSADRAAGRIVVWVAAVADVSTEMTSRMCRTPSTPVARPPLKMSLGLLARYFVPAY